MLSKVELNKFHGLYGLPREELIDLFEQEVRRNHYDPVNSFPEQKYTLGEIREVLINRITNALHNK